MLSQFNFFKNKFPTWQKNILPTPKERLICLIQFLKSLRQQKAIKSKRKNYTTSHFVDKKIKCLKYKKGCSYSLTKRCNLRPALPLASFTDWHRLKSLFQQLLKRWVAYKYCHTLVVSVITISWKSIWQYPSTKTF